MIFQSGKFTGWRPCKNNKRSGGRRIRSLRWIPLPRFLEGLPLVCLAFWYPWLSVFYFISVFSSFSLTHCYLFPSNLSKRTIMACRFGAESSWRFFCSCPARVRKNYWPSSVRNEIFLCCAWTARSILAVQILVILKIKRNRIYVQNLFASPSLNWRRNGCYSPI